MVVASLTTVELVDDLDGGKAAETVAFGVDGVSYEIDLGAKNAKALRKALAEFVEAARPVAPPRLPSLTRPARHSRQSSTSRTPREVTSAIRAWAAEQGIELSTRGRISPAVMAQYEAVQQA